jgi:hypothetical protein
MRQEPAPEGQVAVTPATLKRLVLEGATFAVPPRLNDGRASVGGGVVPAPVTGVLGGADAVDVVVVVDAVVVVVPVPVSVVPVPVPLPGAGVTV